MKKYVFLLVLYYSFTLIPTFNNASFTLKFLDVGQGDSTLLSYKKDLRILVDAGPGTRIEEHLFWEFFSQKCKLDLIFLTHLHRDHFEGMFTVLDKCKIGMLWFNDVDLPTKVYNEFKQKILTKKQIEKVSTSILDGNKVIFGDLKLSVLWPTEEFLQNFDPAKDDLNSMSTVLFIDYKDFEVILPGDAGAEILENLDWNSLKPDIQGGLDILQAPHHGSKTGLTPAILGSLRPKVCVISSGSNNTFGHPAEYTLSILQSSGCKIYRTDQVGTIEFKIK